MGKKVFTSTRGLYFLYLVLYSLIFGLAIYLRFDSSLIALVDEDAEGYLYPAFKLFTSGHFEHVFSRAYAYSLFLSVILLVSSSLNTVVLVQHLLALMGGLMFMRWLFVRTKELSANSGIIKKSLLLFINSSLVFLTLCNGHLIYFEKMIRPEGLLLFFSVILVFLLDRFLSLQRGKKRFLLFFLLSAVLAIELLLFPRWTLGVYSLLALIFFREMLFIVKEKAYTNVIALIVGMLVIALILLPEKYLVWKYESSSASFAYKQFYYSNADAIMRAIDDENVVFDSYDTQVLQSNLQEAYTQGKNGQYILGYPIDYWQYTIGDGELVKLLLQENAKKLGVDLAFCRGRERTSACRKVFDATRIAYSNYYKAWFIKLLVSYPFEVIQKTLEQISHILFSPNYNYFELNDYVFKQQDSWSFPFSKHILISKFSYLPKEVIELNFSGWVKAVFRFYNSLIRILVPITFVVFLFRLKLSRELTIYTLIFLILSILLVAAVHTFDLTRYMYSLSLFICLMVYLIVWDILKPITPKKKSTARNEMDANT